MGMNVLELRLETAIEEAGEFMDVRLSKEDAKQILELLKEREPKPITITTNVYGTKFYHCPNCNKTFYEPLELYKDYCYNCGQELK